MMYKILKTRPIVSTNNFLQNITSKVVNRLKKLSPNLNNIENGFTVCNIISCHREILVCIQRSLVEYGQDMD